MCALVVSANMIPTRAAQLAVERLIVIARYHYTVLLRQQIDDRSLHPVEILKFVYESELVRGHMRGIGRKALVRTIDAVIEINRTVKIRSRVVKSLVCSRAIQITHQLNEFRSVGLVLQPLPILFDERNEARVADE